MLEYFAALSSAKAYADAGKLDAWIHLYLNSNGRNIPLSDGLKLFERSYIGPIEMPIDLFERCADPEDNMKYRIEAKWFAVHVKELEKAAWENPDMPPLSLNPQLFAGGSLNEPDRLLQLFTDRFKEKYGVECVSALRHNKRKTNYRIRLIFSEREMLPEPIEKTAARNLFYDEQGKHVRTRKEIPRYTE